MDKKTLLVVFALFALTTQVVAANGVITLYKFNDANGNGIKDRNEKGTTGSFSITGTNGYNKNVVISQNNRLFTLSVPVPYGATYTITENVPAGYVSTTNNPLTALIIRRVSVCPATACGLSVKLNYGTKKSSAATTTTTTTTQNATTTTLSIHTANPSCSRTVSPGKASTTCRSDRNCGWGKECNHGTCCSINSCGRNGRCWKTGESVSSGGTCGGFTKCFLGDWSPDTCMPCTSDDDSTLGPNQVCENGYRCTILSCGYNCGCYKTGDIVLKSDNHYYKCNMEVWDLYL
ncbi:MAG: hypothetical protein WAX07_07020 [Candidatus Altiarchaeia archaeon]